MKILIAITLIVNTLTFSQLPELRVIGEAQQESSELVSKEIRDANGEVCAGLLIRSDLKGLTYQSNNGIVKINSKPGEDFLFLSANERVVTVYCSGYAPIKLILNDLGIKLKSGQSWSVKVTGDKKLSLIPVNIVVMPAGASVTIDGVKKGTESSFQLSEGKHEILLEKEGYKKLVQPITVSTTQTLFNFSLQEVELQSVIFSSVPVGATIILDNVEKGETNKGIFLYPGQYSLKLSKSGYIDVQQQIEVKENTENKFSSTLTKNIGTLSLSITPSDAKVLINKEDFTGKTSIDLAPGRYKIEIEKTGYLSTSETADIELGKRLAKSYTLTAKTGNLQFSVTPVEAEVVLKQNGSIVQQWKGLKILKGLQVGDYELEVKANGFAPQKKKISILENRTITEDITLAKATVAAPASSSPSSNIEFVFVEGGTFQMGSNDSDDEKPIHSVTVNSFYIGKYEVTQKQWRDVMENNPSNFKGDNLPVEKVSWNDVQEFIRKLNAKDGSNRYRLPTEAEWEYAARGGNKSNGNKYSGSNTVDNVAWYTSNSGSKTQNVGTKQPNELGIYDMSGNVWEWCNDWYDEKYYRNSPSQNPQGASNGQYRVIRGGSWYYLDDVCRVALRFRFYPAVRRYNLGFRLVRNN